MLWDVPEGVAMKLTLIGLGLLAISEAAFAQACPYDPRCTNNPYGAGNPYSPNSVTNPYGQYGSPYSNQSANNPYATNAPKLYDQQGNYRGQLSTNPYAPDSVTIRTVGMEIRTRRSAQITLTGRAILMSHLWW